MTKAEVAATLGISVRTVERMVVAGRLKPGRRLVGGRRTVDFGSPEVERLKEEILAERPSERATPGVPSGATDGMVPVSFRIPPAHFETLRRQAESRAMSPGALARLHVLEAVERVPEADRHAEAVERLRASLAEAFFNFLVLKCATPKDEARRFVRESLLRT